jgi:hypothetical protein
MNAPFESWVGYALKGYVDDAAELYDRLMADLYGKFNLTK